MSKPLTLNHAIKRTKSCRGENALLSLLKTREGVPIKLEEFDKDPNLFQVANGVIDLRTGEFREARMDDYLLKRSPVLYVEGADCPEFKKLLLWAMGGNVTKVEFLQRYFGYLMFGHAQEEVFAILYGNGANGKSTIREAVRMVLGEYAEVADPGLLVNRKSGDRRFDLARLAGVRAAFFSETDVNDRLAEATVKYIVQQEEITAEQKFKDPFRFRPIFKPVLATNNLPRVSGNDLGLWRRMILVPFEQTLAADERDVHFFEHKLKPELPGILNWIIEGAVSYCKIGLAIPESIRRATDEYRETSDIFKIFFADQIVQKSDGVVSCAELIRMAKRWYEKNYGEELPKFVNANSLSRAMKNAGYTAKKNTKGIRCYVGITLRGVDDNPGKLS